MKAKNQISNHKKKKKNIGNTNETDGLIPWIDVYNQRKADIPEARKIFAFGIFCSSTRAAIDFIASIQQEVGVDWDEGDGEDEDEEEGEPVSALELVSVESVAAATAPPHSDEDEVKVIFIEPAQGHLHHHRRRLLGR